MPGLSSIIIEHALSDYNELHGGNHKRQDKSARTIKGTLYVKKWHKERGQRDPFYGTKLAVNPRKKVGRKKVGRLVDFYKRIISTKNKTNSRDEQEELSQDNTWTVGPTYCEGVYCYRGNPPRQLIKLHMDEAELEKLFKEGASQFKSTFHYCPDYKLERMQKYEIAHNHRLARAKDDNSG